MKLFIKLLIYTLLPINLMAHSLLLNVYDNEDGTINIEGIFNTGESASGALVKIEGLNSGKILYEKRLPDEGELNIEIPKIAYKIILDGGIGHEVVKDGIPPKGGFTKEDNKIKTKEKPSKTNMQISPSKAVTVSISIAFILLLLTIFISIRNTNKILNEIKK